MSEVVSMLNFEEINIVEETSFAADALAGATSVTVENGQNFFNLDYIVLDDGEQAELKQINGVVSGETVPISALQFPHKKYDKILKLRGNQLRIYRAANVDNTVPLDAAFSLLTTIDIDVDQEYTDYLDTSGGSGYWYKYTYYNSQTSTETDLSLALAVRGGDYDRYVDVEDIRREAGLQNNREIDDTQIHIRRLHAEDRIKSALKKAGYALPLTNSAGQLYVPPVIENIARLLTAGYILQQDFGPTAGSVERGKEKIDMALADLLKIEEGQLVLVDVDGSTLAQIESVSGWPDETTEDEGTNGIGEPFQFRMSDKF